MSIKYANISTTLVLAHRFTKGCLPLDLAREFDRSIGDALRENSERNDELISLRVQVKDLVSENIRLKSVIDKAGIMLPGSTLY